MCVQKLTPTEARPVTLLDPPPVRISVLTNTNDADGTGNEENPNLDYGKRWNQLAQRHYDPEQDGELTAAIIFAIAEAKGVSPDKVNSPPLYEVIDVPAIESSLLSSRTQGDSRQGTGTIQFRYTDNLVKIRSDGWIQVYSGSEGKAHDL